MFAKQGWAIAIAIGFGLALSWVVSLPPAQALYTGVDVNTSGKISSSVTMTNVLSTCTSFPSTQLSGRRFTALQNQGNAAIWCRTDGNCPASTGDGWRVAADGTLAIDIGPVAQYKCIAAADQADGGSTALIEVR